ncbi:hypothetical protein AB9K34_23760 [Sedimentitalea sp. XS_ASV28]|uniref:hypothetical protein n=1 Tax=Sedimentitalea sp. XS_ASV28 TaxID=3241296 RepID=UPI00351392CF
MRARGLWIALPLCVALSACGDTVGKQALYGAGAGVLGAAVLQGSVVGGAVLGAAGNVLYCQQRRGCR